jgi:hypothetical protein
MNLNRIKNVEDKIKKFLAPPDRNDIDLELWNRHPQRLEFKGWDDINEKKRDENDLQKIK